MRRNTLYFLRSLVAVAAAAVVGACATPNPIPATPQPELSRIAQPYAGDLRKVGISSMTVYGNGARVRVATRGGDVYFRYPAGLAPTAFALYVAGQDVEADSDTFNAGNAAQYEAAIKAIVPQAISLTRQNNARLLTESIDGGR